MKKASMKSNEPRIFDMMRKLINLNFFRYDITRINNFTRGGTS